MAIRDDAIRTVDVDGRSGCSVGADIRGGCQPITQQPERCYQLIKEFETDQK